MRGLRPHHPPRQPPFRLEPRFHADAHDEARATIHFECSDSSAGQLGADSTVQSVIDLDFGKINPVTGPVYVEGAEPGDVLKVTIREFVPSGIGWTANIPASACSPTSSRTPPSTSGPMMRSPWHRLSTVPAARCR